MQLDGNKNGLHRAIFSGAIFLLVALLSACGGGSSSGGGSGGGGGGGGGSGSVSLSSLSPIVAMQNTAAFKLTVNGSGFSSSSQVMFGGSNEPTTFVDSSQLTAQIPGSALSSNGTVQVTVQSGGTTSSGLNFYVVPAIVMQTVNVTAGPGAIASANINVPAFNPPTLNVTAVGLNNSAGATAVDVQQGTGANLLIVGNGIVAGTFYEVSGSNNDVAVTQPVVSAFTTTTDGHLAVNVEINVSATATLGGRNLIVTNSAGEVAAAVGTIVITAPGS